MGKFIKLSTKFAIGFTIIGLAITVGCCTLGYVEHSNDIQRIYNDTSYKIAYIAQAMVDGDAFERYLETGEADEEYYEIEDALTELREDSGSNYIYVGKLEGIDITYVWDADNPDDDLEPFFIGDKGKINPEYVDAAMEVVKTGERSSNYFYSHSMFGYNTSAVVPVYNSKNEIVGIIGVETAMSYLEEVLAEYIVYAVALSVVLIVIIIFCYLRYLTRTVVKPMQVITSEANAFVKANNTVSDKLLKIDSNDEIGLLAQAIYTMETDINQYIEDITVITKEKERIGAELDVAKHIQASMLPCIFPAFPDRKEFDLHASMDPAKEVGGDFYDYFLVDNDHLAIVMADVSGKGVPAALFMVISKTLIKNRALIGEEPATILYNVNNQLCEGNEAQMFVTVWLGIYEISTGKLVHANAGHEYPMIMRAGGKYELLKDNHCFVLGGMEEMPYTQDELTLEVGDRLFLYTDGIPEAINLDEELFNTDRILDVLNKDTGITPQQTIEAMKAATDEYVGEAEQFDDMTMLSFVVKSR